MVTKTFQNSQSSHTEKKRGREWSIEKQNFDNRTLHVWPRFISSDVTFLWSKISNQNELNLAPPKT